MFQLRCKIEIKNPDTNTTVNFDYVNEIEVTTSCLNFTDTAKVTVPRKIKYKGKSITDYIKRNHIITIEMGYGDAIEKVFNGYIKSVSTGTPIVLECENESWKLKQIKLPSKHYSKLSISDFVKEWMPDYTCKIAEANLGEVRINKETTLAKVFEYFMSNYPLKFYFRNDIFYGILPGALTFKEDIETVIFKIGYNTISDNLTYTLAEDVKLQIVAKAITKANTKIEYKEPADSDGAEVRTFLVPGAESVAQLKDYAKNMLLTFKIDKMSGYFTTFGEPFVRKGDFVKLLDEDNVEQNDKKFLVDAVTYTFGQSGFRQKITLGVQIHE